MSLTSGLSASTSRDDVQNTTARRLRVLIADDDRDLALTWMMLLREEGHEVHAVYSGRYVMGAVIDVDPDVVLLDINLPGFSGWEVARLIREKRGNERPVLVGISGEYKDGADKILAEIIGFDHYFLKPCEPTELLDVVASLKHRV
jgi:two-component system, sensor histidine kinase